MTEFENFAELHEQLIERFPGQPMLVKNGCIPTIHLFHASASICSQKVRAVLLATNTAFVSHVLNLFKGESYDPHYVRLRSLGCKATGLPLANDHSGTTSTATTGCDACVVPTVVIPELKEVLVDSKRICIELDRRNTDAPGALMPEHLTEAIEAELDIVDNLPNYQLFVAAGKSPADVNNSFARSKVRRCDDLLAEYANEEQLQLAYKSKRAKELAGANRLFDVGAIERAGQLVETTLTDLDARLQSKAGPFLFGSAPTMADLFWGVELMRIVDFGPVPLWSTGKLPALAAYFQHISEQPDVVGAVR